jgi:hypothetical protein
MLTAKSALGLWWPTTQSMDLAEASLEETALAVHEEYCRFAAGTESDIGLAGRATLEWHNAATLDEAFELIDRFDNVCSQMLILPTKSKWCVMWGNSFLCAGYDSLCWCLTLNHRMTTVHWSAHDKWTTFQSGAMFHYRKPDPSGMVERRVQAAQTDKRWQFFEEGVPLPEEDLAGYQVRKKRDRLNEKRMYELLGRLQARPWDEDFYLLPGRVGLISRPVPRSAHIRTRNDVLTPL